MHIVEGNATVITGGEMIGVHELSATASCGLESVERRPRHTIYPPGDVLAVPAGVPHQFTQVSDPFLYFVVKVEA